MGVSHAALCCIVAATLQAAGNVAVGPPRAGMSLPLPEDIPPPASGFVRIPADTVVDFEIVDALTSKTSRIDQTFAIRLSEPVTLNGKVVLPTGMPGQGQIVHAAKARALGKAGELILAARFLECGATHVALRGFHMGSSGKNKATEMTVAIAAIGPVALPLMFVAGGETVVPAGTRAHARLSAAVDVGGEARPVCELIATPTLTPASAQIQHRGG